MNSVETGAREFGIVQDSIIFSAIKAGQPIGIIYPASGVVALPGVIGISAHGQHQACAQQFVNWVLSPAGQMVMTHHDPTDGDTYFIPVVAGVTPVVTRQLIGFICRRPLAHISKTGERGADSLYTGLLTFPASTESASLARTPP
jgi:iron(III) transport system substrate-binding protein